ECVVLLARLLRRFAALALFFSLRATPPTQIYPLSLHDALPISGSSPPSPPAGTSSSSSSRPPSSGCRRWCARTPARARRSGSPRSEEHTSELQSRENLVCRLLLEKKKQEAPQHCDACRSLRPTP